MRKYRVWQLLPIAAAVLVASGASLAENAAPNAYPSGWDVVYGPAKALPKDYALHQETTTLKKGSTFPPAALALPCDITWDRDVALPLRDGVVIYTDVLRPAGEPNKLPAIIAWSPYGKTLPSKPLVTVPPKWFSGIAKSEGPDAAYWACHGYAVVNPDARGAYLSGGNIQYWGGIEAGDGYDLVEWVAAQPWSNGKVGTHGTSWLAMSQWQIAATRPPHLAAIAPWNGITDAYRDSLAIGGIPDIFFNKMSSTGMTGKNSVELPWATLEKYPLMNDYWEDKAAKLEQINVPAYVTADGATTLHRTGSLEGYRRIASKDKWLRINDTNEWYDQYNPDNEADLLKFFDHFLKGEENGWQSTPKVRVSLLDPGGKDRQDVGYDSWPIKKTKYQRLHLDGSGNAMSWAPAKREATATYNSADGQVAFTYKFEKDVQVTGYLKAHLWVEAKEANDMDLFLLVEKLGADGNVLIPAVEYQAPYFPFSSTGTLGQQRVSLRELDSRRTTEFWPIHVFRNSKKLKAGEVVPVEIAIMPEAVQWHKGQQIRLTISGRRIGTPLPVPNAPADRPIPKIPPLPSVNAGEDVIHTGGRYDSYLQIPVIE